MRSTQQKIAPADWDRVNKLPLRSRGRTDLSIITKKINEYSELLEKVINNIELSGGEVKKEDLERAFDAHFGDKNTKEKFTTLAAFSEDFALRAGTAINATTKRVHRPAQVKNYKKIVQKIKDYDAYNGKPLPLSGFTVAAYDSIIKWATEVEKFSINYTGGIIKTIKVFYNRARYEGYSVADHSKLNLTVLKENSDSITLTEKEITQLLKHDFSETPYLENCRDLSIIGFWTGLRVGDFMDLPDIDITKDFITVEPKKTKESSGIKVVIPLHHEIKEVITKRGMPHNISQQKYNTYIKTVCEKAKVTAPVRGSLYDNDTGRKIVAVYPKYELVSSHTCRRSFATNLYKMNFPALSIMQITGHKSESTFLKYIKVTPTEHAEKLLMHWKEYYNKSS